MAKWATYLLKQVPYELKLEIRNDALLQQTSAANVVRSILCDHYRMECPPHRSSWAPPFQPEIGTLLIRLQPPLFDAIKADALRNAQPQRSIILAILSAHYRNGGTPE